MSTPLPGLNFALGETIDMLRDSVQVFAAEQIAVALAGWANHELRDHAGASHLLAAAPLSLLD